MELFLNSAWAVTAAIIVCLWLCFGNRSKPKRHLSLVALVMLIVILFPVISVSDDLWALHFPAEADTCQRRDHLASYQHSIFSALAGLPESAPAEPSFGFQRLAAPHAQRLLAIKCPPLSSIQNRPPPTA